MERKIDKYIEKYMPEDGWAPTLGGELLRAFRRLEYRYYNDGDYFSRWYGRESSGSAALFIATLCHNYESYSNSEEKSGVVEVIESMACIPYEYDECDKKDMDRDYEKHLRLLEENILKFVKNNNKIFDRKNCEHNDCLHIFEKEAKYAWGDWEKDEGYTDNEKEFKKNPKFVGIDFMPSIRETIDKCIDAGIW